LDLIVILSLPLLLEQFLYDDLVARLLDQLLDARLRILRTLLWLLLIRLLLHSSKSLYRNGTVESLDPSIEGVVAELFLDTP
jgi:hypothetical protein